MRQLEVCQDKHLAVELALHDLSSACDLVGGCECCCKLTLRSPPFFSYSYELMLGQPPGQSLVWSIEDSLDYDPDRICFLQARFDGYVALICRGYHKGLMQHVVSVPLDIKVCQGFDKIGRFWFMEGYSLDPISSLFGVEMWELMLHDYVVLHGDADHLDQPFGEV